MIDIGTEANISVTSVTDLATLERKWRDLEARSNASFFQSWTWTGCLMEERFPDPVVLEVRTDGRTSALALFNRRSKTLYLGQTGKPVPDGIHVEFNGILTEAGGEVGLTTACLRAARAGSAGRSSLNGWGKHRLVLSAVGDITAIAAAETGNVRFNRSLTAPAVDLTDRNICFLDRRSANTRQQIRRSKRDYEATGKIVIDRAETVEQAYEFLDEMKWLHQMSWVARGHIGAFANSFFGRFHRTLIARGLGRGEVDLFHVTAGPRTIGYLYNFRYRGHSLAYQSGFDYAGSGRNEKPGLTCHFEAILFAKRWGAVQYDFLVGDARYKRSLSDHTEALHWIEVAGRYSPRLLAWRARNLVARRRLGLWSSGGAQ